MYRLTWRSSRPWILPTVLAGFALAAAAQVSPDLYSGLQWRNIGPFHGGRIAAVTGVIGQPGTFYAGLPQGGIWETTSGGMTWSPIFDAVTEVDSIGAIQAAPSNPNIIYAGSGDSVANGSTGTDGDGMYKSSDAGKTWMHIGLEDTTKINKLLVDPKNPDLVLASTNLGVFRTTDGGQNWANVLKPDGADGTRDLEYAFDMPDVMFATTMGGGGGGGGGFGGGGGGCTPGAASCSRLYKSVDEGRTWTQITTLPPYTGRVGVAVAMNTRAQRVFVVGGAQQGGSGLFRSDDGGQTWAHMAGDDTRIGGSGYSCGVWVDSQNPDILYTMSTSAYRSTDGGRTFEAFKGAPGGEDMHEIWIDPTDGHRMIFGVDQGAAITFDGGRNWSSYFALPVDQVYHISTDDRYPYWVLASQQDTGAIMVRERGDEGQISPVDWLPLPSSENGTVTPDPIDPNIVYGVGYGAAGGSGLVKINLATGQWENANPGFGVDAALYRAGGNTWRKFDPFDPHTLYADYQCLLVSHDQGHSWKPFSPDLTTAQGEPEVACGTPLPAGAAAGAAATAAGAAPSAPALAPTPAVAAGGRGGAGGTIADFSISTAKKGAFWTVSGNGQIFTSSADARGEMHWDNVSNIQGATGVTFNTIEAGHNDVNTAYISARRGGGRGAGGGAAGGGEANAPLIWRTHDGGKTWTEIVNGLPTGLPTGSWVNVVREDPVQKGLLFAGTETTVYVSFDDGDHWQSLRQNLPSTSIRDMVFHSDDHMNDLVIGTYGRSFWVLDDMTPLREVAQKAAVIAAAPAYLFKPGDAIRARIGDNWDMPLNREQPQAPNPPYGAIFYYHLSRPPQGEIKLQVFDAAGSLVRTISSIAPTLPERLPYPSYWAATPESLALSTQVGTNRFHWDLRYDDPPAFNFDIENQVNFFPGGVTPGPHGMQVIPGIYTMKLSVDGQTYTQTVTVHNDPRVGESPKVMADLKAKNQLMVAAWNGAKSAYAGNREVYAVRTQLAAVNKGTVPADVAIQATAIDAKLATFGGVAAGRGGRGGGGGGRGRGGAAPGSMEPFNTINGSFDTLVSLQQVGLDEAPTQAEVDTWQADCKNYNATVAAWKVMLSQDLVAFNAVLTRNSLQPLSVTPTKLTDLGCSLTATAAQVAKGN